MEKGLESLRGSVKVLDPTLGQPRYVCFYLTTTTFGNGLQKLFHLKYCNCSVLLIYILGLTKIYIKLTRKTILRNTLSVW